MFSTDRVASMLFPAGQTAGWKAVPSAGESCELVLGDTGRGGGPVNTQHRRVHARLRDQHCQGPREGFLVSVLVDFFVHMANWVWHCFSCVLYGNRESLEKIVPTEAGNSTVIASQQVELQKFNFVTMSARKTSASGLSGPRFPWIRSC